MRRNSRREVYRVAVWWESESGYGGASTFDTVEKAKAEAQRLHNDGFDVVDVWKETILPIQTTTKPKKAE